ncbi:DUF2938 domain-containing protein [Marinomonas sp. CT5]|uniref:DUF2938 domain-containing protein n=1 Tax=Marinomonas sp. CT5 TaxID=2066133 RepID=UPI001857C2CF|nr:DUF2938 domain-containing protein [Marinomonas sp. CT5]NVK72946.1 DUF2938 domain-containing protein [Oceanospirillaceae bacterium]QUX97249.1 DUF2938 domain-containing protein [Marinomonas sp. CT5]
MQTLLFILIIGIGATFIMDIWAIVRKYLLGIPSLNYGMVGRWIGHMMKGRFHHESIGKSPTIPYENVIGWISHYAIGIAFAAVLVSLYGITWTHTPTIVPALTVGIATVVAPFFILQPGMGAGIAASRTPKPTSARIHSLINHAIFGFGLYLSGWILNLFTAL